MHLDVNRVLEQAREIGAPIIQEEKVTFVWEGKRAPDLIADFTDWEENPIKLNKVKDQVWIHVEQLPNKAYIEYAYLDQDKDIRVPDPFNSRSVPNGLGEINHFFYMPGAKPPSIDRRKRGIAKGKISSCFVPTEHLAIGKKRRVWFYQPATQSPSPLVVVLDGNDYLRQGKLPNILDNLIALNRVQPVALAMVAHGGAARVVEYLCSEATLAFIYEQVIPLARQELNLLDPSNQPGAFGIMGASMGGLMAMYAGMRMPDLFGHVLSQSGAFSFLGHDFVVMDLVRYIPPLPIKIWMDVGKFESLLSSNQRMYKLLSKRGYQVQYREYPGGHNYTSWRNDLWRGLEFLFPQR